MSKNKAAFNKGFCTRATQVARKSQRGILAAVVTIILLGLTPVLSADVISTGFIYGEIRFDGTNGGVGEYLSSNPLAGGTVSAVQSGGVGTSSSAASIPSIPAPPLLANYQMLPAVDQITGIRVYLSSTVRFANGSNYLFKTTNQSTLVQAVSNVSSSDPNAVRQDISECAVRATVMVKIVGPNGGPVPPGLNNPATVVVSAHTVMDPSSPGSTKLQAVSAVESVTISELTSLYGAPVNLLVRGDETLRFNAEVTFNSDDLGFPYQPGAGSLVRIGGMTEQNYTTNCEEEFQGTTISIPVERNAGRLTGVFDVQGRAEPNLITVNIDRGDLEWHTRPSIAGNTRPYSWAFESVAEGYYNVQASALIDSDSAVVFPKETGVSITQGATTDLGQRFVFQPATVQFTLSLRDPNPDSWLASIGQHSRLVCNLDNVSGDDIVRMKGVGGQIIGSDGSIIAENGNGAQGGALLHGQYDPIEGVGVFQALVPLVGRNDNEGSAMRPVEYELGSVTLGLSPMDGSMKQYLALTATTRPSSPVLSTPGSKHSWPSLDICFGYWSRQVRSNTGILMQNPTLTVGGSRLTPDFDPIQNDGRSVDYSYVVGSTYDNVIEGPSESVIFKSALPAFLAYDSVSRGLDINFVGGAVTSTQLPHTSIKALHCGEQIESCENIDERGEGLVSSLSANILASDTYCEGEQQVDIQLYVESEAEISKVTLFRDGNEITLCELGSDQSCPNPFDRVYTFNNLVQGRNRIELRARDTLRCKASNAVDINVFPAPVLNCKESITTISEDGNAVPYSAVENEFRYSWEGGCMGQQFPQVMIEHPTEFTWNEDGVSGTVTFRTESGEGPGSGLSCTTDVYVRLADGCIGGEIRQLPIGRVSGSELTLGSVTFKRLNEEATWRVSDNYPIRSPDGRMELGVPSSGLDIELPFPAREVWITYLNLHGNALKFRVYDNHAKRLFPWHWLTPSGEDQRLLHTRRFADIDAITRLEVISWDEHFNLPGDSEAAIVNVCYYRDGKPFRPGNFPAGSWPPGYECHTENSSHAK